jgi:acetylornithine/N-succinyldiaminopimelate aminotransferase
MRQVLMETYQRLPVAFESGEGVWLLDREGNRYLDAISGIAVCSLGHAHPEVARAVADQAAKLVHTSNLYRIPLQEELGELLCGLTGTAQAFFCNSGAEANEAAIKICRKFAHEQGMNDPVIVAMDGGFHGRTLAALTATGNQKVRKGFAPLVPGFRHVPFNDPQALLQLADSGLQIAGVMLEPIQGEGGVIIPSPGYLRSVRKICNDNGWLMIVDEVQTGMCRSGAWFACLREDVVPDLMTLAKSLGNGVPIGACLAGAEVAGLMGPGSHGSTFGGNPLASRAALTVVGIMQKLRSHVRAAQLGERMLLSLRASLAGTPGIREIRGSGLMLGIEFDHPCGGLVEAALKRGLLINVTAERVLRLLPPLIATDAEADLIVERTVDTIRAAQEQTA